MALFSGEPRGQECADEIFRQLNADHARPQNPHVHIVVLAPLVG